ncbi:AraC-type DNA-binding protein [Paenibacillus catalpae]|uniref:AraC-type DNA-binding protein n=1 Tax=Paenibacillus catalpae TaxID=1045775 RepID=A0A1I1U3K9_9BACL|nr:AraC family transcriptional regulator [Paenibacillus catalpae]SFD65436.1 AraC-type DNA-binding protein [Paenibacillus catalpae]
MMEGNYIFCSQDETSGLPLYATTVGYWEHQIETERPQGFPDYQLHQVLDGFGEVIVNGKSYKVEPGDVFFLYPDTPHSYRPLNQQWKVSWVSFNGREAQQMLLFVGIGESGTGRLKANKLIKPLEQMLTLDMDNEQEANLERSKLLYGLLIDLKYILLSPSSSDQEFDRIKPVLQYIESNLQRALSLAELAEVASVTPQYLCRIFQQTLNIRPMEYINQQRIKRSKQLMFQYPNMRMYELAGRVGFESSSYYGAVFRRLTGMNPEAFKKLHGLVQ